MAQEQHAAAGDGGSVAGADEQSAAPAAVIDVPTPPLPTTQPPPLPHARAKPAAGAPKPAAPRLPAPAGMTAAPPRQNSAPPARDPAARATLAAAQHSAPERSTPERSTPERIAPDRMNEEPDASRRVARRRPAGPARTRIAANDDTPSIGGLIYALEQKPSNRPYWVAGLISIVWALIGAGLCWTLANAELSAGGSLTELATRPAAFLALGAALGPIALIWFLASLSWRSEELRLRSSAMTEVAVRLAEPDRMAEQSIASLGQAVRRQVSFMNDAVTRALGRAGELEALVHSEVAALERSYEENERKIRGLIQELSGEREALVTTSDRVSDTLKHLGTEVPVLIDRLANQQIKLTHIIQGAGDNLTNLEGALASSTGRLETALGSGTDRLQGVLESYTGALATALGSRTESLQAVFEEYTHALDTTLAHRAQSLDSQLVDRVKSLDSAFGERLRLLDESILQSSRLIDSAVGEKSRAITAALDTHARAFNDTVSRQASDLDETLMHGINAVRRSSESITRQSLKAIEGLAGQSEMLKQVSEGLLGQIHAVSNRFDAQGQNILRAAQSLESVNHKIDGTLQARHTDLSNTLDRLTGKADEFGRFVEGYSSTLEGSLSDAEKRARHVAEEMQRGAEAKSRLAIAEVQRLKTETESESERAMEDLRRRFANVSTEVTQQLGSLTSRFDETSSEVRERAARTAAEFSAEHARIRQEMDRLPAATRESTEAVRHALSDQLKALDQLSAYTNRTAATRDIAPPLPSLAGSYATNADASRAAVTSVSASLAAELSARRQASATSPAALPPGPAGSADQGREGWSLGDLLARASRPENGSGPAGSAETMGNAPFTLALDVVSRALDAATASAIWSRLRSGQRGIMVRSIYTPEGRASFDDVARRYQTDAGLRATIDRYITDFGHMLQDSDATDPSGRLSMTHIVSETGRVFLFLSHAAGRLA